MNHGELRQHILIVRFLAAALLVIFLALGVVLALAIGPGIGWNSGVLVGFVVSAALTIPAYIAAGPIARRVSKSIVTRFYTIALIRLASAILVAQFGTFFAFALNAGITPFLLGAGTATILLFLALAPRQTATTG
ncbi:hypothetical protein [Micromonospora sp. WMMD1082]|uniref:hypothetical protein n=1 Tax=Micromonospora sp. WMMD1082 TaxID=3016104 RepID=UPI0024172C3E|nr:hypothetical protein [Micromonospora sp. WMMD1082]MDG4796721.1 hypothetical protein [Micromonospora sp. WMMD1082]